MPLKLEVGDIIETKKEHPCGSKMFLIERVGMDFRIKCQGCGKDIWIPRVKIEKRVKKAFRNDERII